MKSVLNFLKEAFSPRNLIRTLISLFFGTIIACLTICNSCTLFSSSKESFAGAPLDYRLGNGVPNDNWTTPLPVTHEGAVANMYAPLAGNVGGKVPLAEGQLFFFYDNKFKPECCFKPQQYSSSTGCACISVDQMKHLNARGGNNTLP